MKSICLSFLLAALLTTNPSSSEECKNNTLSVVDERDAHLTVPQLISKYGYPVEVHHVVTADGYILELHRIPYGKYSGSALNKSMVFVQHGLLCSSADWIIPGPQKGLGYLLADLSYDVWLGNSRGSTYSKNHTSLNPREGKFWDFSFHEVGMYDLPAMLDYSLKVSGQKQTFYIGHSQGTTSFFVLCSQKPEYNAKIRAQFSLSPIAYMSHMTSPLLRVISNFKGPLEIILKILGVHQFLPSTSLMAEAGKLLCSEKTVTQIICQNTFFIVCGYSTSEMDTKLLPVILGHTPAGGSTYQFLHYAQLIHSGKFRQWDYKARNFDHYQSQDPPQYELRKVTAPVALFYSHYDWLSSPIDVFKLYKELGNPIGKFLVTNGTFNHIDYMWGKNVVNMVYKRMFRMMKYY